MGKACAAGPIPGPVNGTRCQSYYNRGHTIFEAPAQGQVAASVSNAIVGLFRTHLGKGPERAKTYVHEDLIVCLLEGGYSRSEATLQQAGRGDVVQESRDALQDAIESDMRAEVERITGRVVVAFMSANSPEAGLSLESFVLESRSAA